MSGIKNFNIENNMITFNLRKTFAMNLIRPKPKTSNVTDELNQITANCSLPFIVINIDNNFTNYLVTPAAPFQLYVQI